jgi:CheY-like chemotaxis protein
VVLLDFVMPILGGAEMLRAMAAEPAYQHIPVIMISSLGENAIAKKCASYAAFLHRGKRRSLGRIIGKGSRTPCPCLSLSRMIMSLLIPNS